MAIYIVLYSFMVIILGISRITNDNVTRHIFLCFVFIELWLFASLRYQVGTDYQTYLDFFNVNSGSFEPVYYLLRDLLSLLHLSPLLFFSLSSFITLFFFFKAALKFDPSYCELIIILYLFTGLYTNSLNMVRQYTALSVYLYFAFPGIVKKKFLHYFIGVLLATMFHYSAMLMLPVYFLVRAEYGIKSGITLILLALVFNLGLFNVDFVNGILPFFPEKYAGYLQFLQHYLLSLSEPLYLKFLNNIDKIIICFLLLYRRKKLQGLSKYNFYFINFYLFFTVFTIATRGLEELQRLGYYFYIFSPFAIVLVARIWEENFKKISVAASIVIVYFAYNIFIILMKNYGGIIPYQTIFHT